MSDERVEGCWASGVSPCRGSLSREHFLSRNLWPTNHVTVRGGPWGDVEKTIGLESLVVRCLCEGHNSALSELDTVAGDYVNVQREMNRLIHAPARRQITFEVDGWRLERWALKVAFGAAATMRQRLEDWRPPAEAARYVFGEGLLEGRGLAMLHRVGDKVIPGDRFTLAFGAAPDEPISAMTLAMHGFRFSIEWHPSAARGLRVDGELFDASELLYRPNKINVRTAKAPIFVRFSWRRTQEYRPARRVQLLR